MRCQLLSQGIIGVLLLCAGPANQAAETNTPAWEGLQRMMAPEEFREAGLDKLSGEELERLDRWILEFLAHDSTLMVQKDEAIRQLQEEPVRRQIPGHFRGWEGDTVFTLDNGEVWKQRMPSRYFTSLEDPEVEISRNLLGYYELEIVKTGRRVGVTRIK